MADKTFVVTHSKAREPITIEGKTLEKALEKARLNPAIWHLVEEPETPSEGNFGKDS